MRFCRLVLGITSLLVGFGIARAQQVHKKLEIARLTGDFYIFKTYSLYKGNSIPANGMYLVTDKGAVLFDSPWDTTQFQPLLDSIQNRHHKKVVMCFATHFHEDRTAGLEYYRAQGISTFTSRMTDDLSRQRGMKRAAFILEKDSIFRLGNYSFQTYYPGKGHAPDNIVIWFARERILYGGCLVKSVEDTSLGNLGDASVGDYPQTLEKLQRLCGNARYIIPGHNDWTDKRSLQHTLNMARELKAAAAGQSGGVLQH